MVREERRAGAQPLRQVNVGAAQGPSAGEIPVDQSAECLRADLSLPGSFGSFMARVFLDSGSALTSIGVGLLSRMSSSFGGAALQIPARQCCPSLLLVILDDLSNFVSLEPAEACRAEVTAKHLLNWLQDYGVPRVWV